MESIRTGLYIICSTAIHAAAIISITLSPSLLQLGGNSLFGDEPAMHGQNGNEATAKNIEVVEIEVAAPVPATQVQAPEPVQIEKVIAAPKVEKKTIKKAEKKVAAKETEASLPEKKIEEVQEANLVADNMSKSEVMKDLAMDEDVKSEDIQIEEPAEDKKEEVQQAKSDEMPEKDPQDSAEETKMLEAVAAADAAEEATQEKVAEATEAQDTKEDETTEEALPAPVVSEAKATPAEAETSTATASTAAEKSTELPAKPGSPNGSEAAKATVAQQNFLELRQMPGNKPPVYPERSRMERAEGSGQLKYFVTKDGKVTNLTLTKSTGHPELDQAAIQGFKDFRFVPGQAGYTVHDFRFALKGSEVPARGRLRTTLNNQ